MWDSGFAVGELRLQGLHRVAVFQRVIEVRELSTADSERRVSAGASWA